MRCVVTILCATWLCFSNPFGADTARADKADAARPVSFHNDVRPVFQAHCYGCHQPAKRRGELDMTSRAALLKGGESDDPAIVPGKPNEGSLLAMITPSGGKRPEMPKGRTPLSADQIKLVRLWIEQGAKDDSPKISSVRFTKENPPKYKLAPVVTSIGFSPNNALMAVSGYHEVLLHAADGSKLVARLIGMSERIEAVKFSPSGRLLAVTGGSPGRFGEVQIWDVAKRELLRSVVVTYDTVYGASWSHDEKLVAFGCADSTLRAIEIESGKQVFHQSAHDDWVLDAVFSADSTHLVSVSRDMSMKLSVVATQRFVDNITSITPGALKGGLHAVDRHPDKDELVIGGVDGVPKIYRMHREKDRKIGDDYNLIRKLPQMPGRVFDVAFSRDGALVAVGSSNSGEGHVWVCSESDGKLVAKMDGIKGGIYSVGFAGEGKTVAAGGFDGIVFLNDAMTGKLIKQFVPVPLSKSK
jgi:WD40 repeat protein